MIASLHLRYWGKARLPDATDTEYHLLCYHCLDVAAVGVTLLKRSPALRTLLASALPFESDDALRSWFGFCLAIHDLGKFAESFQGQRSDLVERMRGREADPGKPYAVRHDTLGWLIWDQHLKDRAVDRSWFGPESEKILEGIDWWFRATMGHHGLPPAAQGYWRHHFAPEDVPAIEGFLEEVLKLFPATAISTIGCEFDPQTFHDTSKVLSWWIAGITVLADWIGSNTRFFPYRSDECPLADYWQEVQEPPVPI